MNLKPVQSEFFALIANHRFLWLVAVGLLGVFLDQATKSWAQHVLAAPYQVTEEVNIDGRTEMIVKEVFYPIKIVEVIPLVFNLIYKENPAAAFSLTRSLPSFIRRPMLLIVSVLAILFFLFWYARMRVGDGLLVASFSLILAGALGNLIDRIRFGYVIDFLDVHAGLFGYPQFHWPTFNIADSLIVVGAVGVVCRTIWPLKMAAIEDERHLR